MLNLEGKLALLLSALVYVMNLSIIIINSVGILIITFVRRMLIVLDEQATVTLSDSFEWNEELKSCVLISPTSPSTSFKYVLDLSSLQVEIVIHTLN